MLLTTFLHDLLQTGVAAPASRPAPFAPADLAAAEELLHRYYARDVLELPHAAPPFEPTAANWAAALLYHTVQLTVNRELDATVVATLLPDYPAPATPAATYSADLLLRYLPDLLTLARGLAPGDALVARLQVLARQWPLSFVGHGQPAAPAAEAALLTHPALRQAYVDRLIQARDQASAARPALRPLVQAALGAHAATLWPDFAEFVALADASGER